MIVLATTYNINNARLNRIFCSSCNKMFSLDYYMHSVQSILCNKGGKVAYFTDHIREMSKLDRKSVV